jgi:hypothetical protein
VPVTNDIALLHARVDELHALISPLLPRSSVKADLRPPAGEEGWQLYLHAKGQPLFVPDTYVDVLFTDGLKRGMHNTSVYWGVSPGRPRVLAFRVIPDKEEPAAPETPDETWWPYLASYPYTMPVDAGPFVDVMLGDGTFSYRRGPRSLNWSNLPPPSRRIVAYRVSP